jgi:RNA polymerase sigma-70 factor (ECF subfamily)
MVIPLQGNYVDKKMDESALIQTALKGDLSAYNRLILDYQDLAYNLAYWILGDEEQASQAVQDAVKVVYRKLADVPRKPFKIMLLRQVTQSCKPVLKKYGGKNAGILGSKILELRENLKALRPETRALVYLVDIEGFDYQDASTSTGIPLEGICPSLAKARMLLCRTG